MAGYKNYNQYIGNPDCYGFIRKGCNWVSNGWAGGDCQNSKNRNAGPYCSREQTSQPAYRGVDGHSCPNLGHYFMIFEHDGGSHYCGGWTSTGWRKVEMWIQ